MFFENTKYFPRNKLKYFFLEKPIRVIITRFVNFCNRTLLFLWNLSGKVSPFTIKLMHDFYLICNKTRLEILNMIGNKDGSIYCKSIELNCIEESRMKNDKCSSIIVKYSTVSNRFWSIKVSPVYWTMQTEFHHVEGRKRKRRIER